MKSQIPNHKFQISSKFQLQNNQKQYFGLKTFVLIIGISVIGCLFGAWDLVIEN